MEMPSKKLPRFNRAEYRNTLRDLLGFELIVRGLPQQPHHRRVSLDLTGLPPTPAEVDQFLNDKSPNPSENLTERFPRPHHRLRALPRSQVRSYSPTRLLPGQPLLATEFVAQGWRVKAMHLVMMSSEAYRMSSNDAPVLYKFDEMRLLTFRVEPRRSPSTSPRSGLDLKPAEHTGAARSTCSFWSSYRASRLPSTAALHTITSERNADFGCLAHQQARPVSSCSRSRQSPA